MNKVAWSTSDTLIRPDNLDSRAFKLNKTEIQPFRIRRTTRDAWGKIVTWPFRGGRPERQPLLLFLERLWSRRQLQSLCAAFASYLSATMFAIVLLAALVLTVFWMLNIFVVQPFLSPLKNLPGPEPRKGLGFQGHLRNVLEYVCSIMNKIDTLWSIVHESTSLSKATHEDYTKKYGRNIRIKGLANVSVSITSSSIVKQLITL